MAVAKVKNFLSTFNFFLCSMEGIKNIIFDLGGVILNIDYNYTSSAFRELGFDRFDEQYSQLKQTGLFDDLETGKIGQREFFDAIREVSGVNISDSDITAAWNEMLLDFPLRRLQILQQVQLHYNTFLLSNTNEIHEKAFNDMLNTYNGIPNIALFFNKVYLSHRIGMRKPNANVFQYILDQNGLEPEETLFIDDSPQHIAAAEALGIRTIHLTNGMTLEDDIFKPKQAV